MHAAETATATAIAPGKLVLVGEYAVLEGAPAWVTAVNRFARVSVFPAANGPRLLTCSPSRQEIPLERTESGWSAGAGWALASGAYERAFPDGAVDLEIDTRDFFLVDVGGQTAKAGFGSSAAVVAAILAAAGATAQDQLFALARSIHQHAQGGMGSGVDICAAVYGGSQRYLMTDTRPAITPLEIPPGLSILAVWMGQSASTPQLLGRVLEWKTSHADEYDRLMEAMISTAADAALAARENDIPGLLDALEEYGRRMAQLGRSSGAPIVTQPMEDLAGRLGGRAVLKPSGAGGGDIALAFCAAEDTREIQGLLELAGAHIVPLDYGAPGASLTARQG